MYKSPVELITKQINSRIEEEVFEIIREFGINIDKEEFIRALQYDRDQYEQGYRDGQQVNKWISVEDRLPNKNQDVLIYKGNHIGDMIYVYTYLGNNEWEDEYGYWSRTDDESITHWMSLPEPPREED